MKQKYSGHLGTGITLIYPWLTASNSGVSDHPANDYDGAYILEKIIASTTQSKFPSHNIGSGSPAPVGSVGGGWSEFCLLKKT